MAEQPLLATIPTSDVDGKPSDRPTEPNRIDDYYSWSIEQAAHIRAGRFDQIDTLNVAEEIEDVGKSEKRELVSNLENILVHVLKWSHQPQRRGRSWALSIAEHRRRVERNLDDNPSLAGQFVDLAQRAYDVARLRTARETGLPLTAFPLVCPYDRHEIMTAPYDFDES